MAIKFAAPTFALFVEDRGDLVNERDVVFELIAHLFAPIGMFESAEKRVVCVLCGAGQRRCDAHARSRGLVFFDQFDFELFVQQLRDLTPEFEFRRVDLPVLFDQFIDGIEQLVFAFVIVALKDFKTSQF